jgi:ethanolamine utilization protein EutN
MGWPHGLSKRDKQTIMKLGRVVGRVWATIKDPKLTGVLLSVLQPIDETLAKIGPPLIAADIINSKLDDVVYWVGGAEATFPLADRQIPSDVSIVGLVDRVHTKKS